MTQPRPHVVYVRLADDGGRLVPVEVYVPPDGEPLSSAVLRHVPLAEVERWASLPGPAKALRARLGAAGPDLHRAAGAYARSHGGPPRHWVDWMLTAQGEDSESQAPSIIERLPEELSQNKVRQVRGAAARLDVPERPPYGEEFYRRVAETYLRLVDGTYAPAALIADANGVNVGRVRWWIAEARRMGYLPPGRKGKAG